MEFQPKIRLKSFKTNYSAEDRAKAQEQNEKKRPRQSDSEGSETDKQKPKRVYPLRSRSISGDPRDNKTKVLASSNKESAARQAEIAMDATACCTSCLKSVFSLV